jgi:ATP-dependent RNA circularization protein (DNA/RNA ligase family)
LTQQAEKKIGIGQEKILTEKARDWKDLIIITEKIDGSNVGVIKKNGGLVALSRAGYSVDSSPYEQHKLFAEYVNKHIEMFSWLPEGWRIVGEWCIMAHGTVYDISEESPFVSFDIIDNKNKRILYLDFLKLCIKYNIPNVPLLHIGQPVSLKNAIKKGTGQFSQEPIIIFHFVLYVTQLVIQFPLNKKNCLNS